MAALANLLDQIAMGAVKVAHFHVKQAAHMLRVGVRDAEYIYFDAVNGERDGRGELS